MRERHDVVLSNGLRSAGQAGPQRRERQLEHALRGGGAERRPGRAEAAVEQQLREEPAEGVADDDRRAVEPVDDPRVVVDDVLHGEAAQR